MTGGRRLAFTLPAPRLAFALGTLFEFKLLCTGVPAGFAFTFPFPLVTRLALALLLRFRLAGRFVFAFKLSLPFLLTGFFFCLLSFELVLELVVLLFSGFFSVLDFSLEFVEVGVSPSLDERLMSTATVCPTLTISPA